MSAVLAVALALLVNVAVMTFLRVHATAKAVFLMSAASVVVMASMRVRATVRATLLTVQVFVLELQ
tara:strand:- start:303 stop:500 length:198 start_codon:yes stop_codon:yes gene_type:complete